MRSAVHPLNRSGNKVFGRTEHSPHIAFPLQCIALTVQVLDQLDDTPPKRRHHHGDLRPRRLLAGPEPLHELLSGAGSVDVERYADEVGRDAGDNTLALVNVTVVEKLLAKVVAEGIGREFDNVFDNLAVYQVHGLASPFVELPLKEATAKLVTRQLVHLHGLKFKVMILTSSAHWEGNFPGSRTICK